VAIVRGDRGLDLAALPRILGSDVQLARAREVRQVLDVGPVTPLSPRIRGLNYPSELEDLHVKPHDLVGEPANNSF
jgi:hypothetical protein